MPNMQILYVLQNVSAGYVGDCALFWRKNAGGYTTNLNEAEQMTLAQAEAIINGTAGSHQWRLWEWEDLFVASVPHVTQAALNELAPKEVECPRR